MSSSARKVTQLVYNIDGNAIDGLSKFVKAAREAATEHDTLRKSLKEGKASQEDVDRAASKAAKALRELGEAANRADKSTKNLGDGAKKLGNILTPMAGDLGDVFEGFEALAEGGGSAAVALGAFTLGMVAVTAAVVGGVKAIYSLAQGAVDAREKLLLPYEIADRVSALENSLNASAEAGNRLAVSFGVISSEEGGGRVIRIITGITDAMAEAVAKGGALSEKLDAVSRIGRVALAAGTLGGTELARFAVNNYDEAGYGVDSMEKRGAALEGQTAAYAARAADAAALEREGKEAKELLAKEDRYLAEQERKHAEATRDATSASRDQEAASKALSAKYRAAIGIVGDEPNRLGNIWREGMANAGTAVSDGGSVNYDPRADYLRTHPGSVFSVTDSTDMAGSAKEVRQRARAMRTTGDASADQLAMLDQYRESITGGVAAGFGAAGSFSGGGAAGGIAGASSLLSLAGPIGMAMSAALPAVMKPRQFINDLVDGLSVLAERLPGALMTLLTNGVPKLLAALPQIIISAVTAGVAAVFGIDSKKKLQDVKQSSTLAMDALGGNVAGFADRAGDIFNEARGRPASPEAAARSAANASRGMDAARSASRVRPDQLGGIAPIVINYQGLGAPTDGDIDRLNRRLTEAQLGRGRTL